MSKYHCPHCGTEFKLELKVVGKGFFRNTDGKRLKAEELIVCSECDRKFMRLLVARPHVLVAKLSYA